MDCPGQHAQIELCIHKAHLNIEVTSADCAWHESGAEQHRHIPHAQSTQHQSDARQAGSTKEPKFVCRYLCFGCHSPVLTSSVPSYNPITVVLDVDDEEMCTLFAHRSIPTNLTSPERKVRLPSAVFTMSPPSLDIPSTSALSPPVMITRLPAIRK